MPLDCAAELLRGCVTPQIEPAQAAAIASALRECLAPRHLPAWGCVLEASGALFGALGTARWFETPLTAPHTPTCRFQGLKGRRRSPQRRPRSLVGRLGALSRMVSKRGLFI